MYQQSDTLTAERERARKAAMEKCSREQRPCAVYQDNKDPWMFYLVGEGTASDRMLKKWKFIDEFDPDNLDEENVGKLETVEIEDYRKLEVGDRVFVDDEELTEVTKISKFQFNTANGMRFRYRDGVEYGDDDGHQVTKKIVD